MKSVSHCGRAIGTEADEVSLNYIILRTGVEIDAIGIASNHVSGRQSCATNYVVLATSDADPESTGSAQDGIACDVCSDKITRNRIAAGLNQNPDSRKAIDR